MITTSQIITAFVLALISTLLSISLSTNIYIFNITLE